MRVVLPGLLAKEFATATIEVHSYSPVPYVVLPESLAKELVTTAGHCSPAPRVVLPNISVGEIIVGGIETKQCSPPDGSWYLKCVQGYYSAKY